jgi:hypothetical protein
MYNKNKHAAEEWSPMLPASASTPCQGINVAF